jgi:hypothetical protein
MQPGGGGYDLGLSLSGSSSASSGIGAVQYGDKITGGFKLPGWLPLVLVGAGVVVSVVALVLFARR